MKKILYSLFAILCLGFAACDDDEVVINKNIVGEWHIESFSGEKPADFDIYIAFKDGGSFDLYQKGFSTPRWVRFDGGYSTAGKTVSGRYSDGVKWSYDFSLSEDGDRLTLQSNTSVRETTVYVRKRVPQEIVEGADYFGNDSSRAADDQIRML